MKKHLLVVGIVFLFVGMGFQPAFANERSIVSSSGKSNIIIENHPPYVPGNYSPCGYVSENMVNLSWDGGDPDPKDSVYYDVYFGESYPFNITTIGPYPANQTRIEFGPIELECFTHYFWYICAYDENSNSSGDLICFLSRRCENLPPEAPKVWWSPKYPKPFERINLTFNSVDPNGDDVRFLIDWGDGDTEWTTYVPSGTNKTVSHMVGDKGTYYINVTAEGSGGMSDVTTVKIIVGKTRAVNVEDCDCQKVSEIDLDRLEKITEFKDVLNMISILSDGDEPPPVVCTYLFIRCALVAEFFGAIYNLKYKYYENGNIVVYEFLKQLEEMVWDRVLHFANIGRNYGCIWAF